MNFSNGPKGCNIGDWEGRCEMRGRDKWRKDKEEWEVRDKGYGASRFVVQHHRSTHQVTLLMILRTILTPLILFQQLTYYDSPQPWGSTPSSSSQVIGSSHLSIFILFPMMSHVFHFITHFWFIICLSCCSEKDFLEFSSDSLIAIAYWSLKCCLVILDPLMYIRRLSLPQRKGNLIQVSFSAQLFSAKS